MTEKHIDIISGNLNINAKQVINTIRLLDEGSTIPFISRYRKEATGSLDEIQISRIKDLLNKLSELDKRRDSIIKSIGEQGKLTADLRRKLEMATSQSELEDLYLPYRPKRKTRASVARENGLEPLARAIMEQRLSDIGILAKKYINEKVRTAEDALQGARDIIAERVNEDKKARYHIRKLYSDKAYIISNIIKGKEQDGIKYKDYYEFSEPLNKCASHRMLAMRRGENEGYLRLSIRPDNDEALKILEGIYFKAGNKKPEHIKTAVEDSYKRLLGPSIENEFRAISKLNADNTAIKVFADNLRQLLMASPLGEQRILALDPGFRTGCKVVCLDAQGNLLHNETIYPHPPQSETRQAAKKITTLVSQYKTEAIAIGNGTASRETEKFVKRLKFDRELNVFIVNEAGASIYSASKVGREEFPEYDVTVRGAVSIGRRLMDPLAELVKIDPKSIGVGQYQHDVDQVLLKKSLVEVVESCVNSVGVDLNTASKYLLTYISGLGPRLAENIIDYRKKNGAFSSREELKKVPLMGEKVFEQSAGFLRIKNGANLLDNTAVHPESYHIINKIAGDKGVKVKELIDNKELKESIDINKYTGGSIGIPTLKDIMDELAKPGRDPRTKIKIFEFTEGIYSIEDVKPGMILPGIITNITNFGVFVDIGVKQDGLVHISQMADRYVSNPAEVVTLHQHVRVKVLEVDIERKRIQLSMKEI